MEKSDDAHARDAFNDEQKIIRTGQPIIRFYTVAMALESMVIYKREKVATAVASLSLNGITGTGAHCQ